MYSGVFGVFRRTKLRIATTVLTAGLLLLLVTGGLFTMASDSPTKEVLPEYAKSGQGTVNQLRLMTFNIAELKPSKEAPTDWSEEYSQALLTDLILAEHPHVICLQECPSKKWAESFLSDEYTSIGAVPTHAGYVTLLVASHLSAEQVPLRNLPAVTACISDDGYTSVVASVHLEPFENGSGDREKQMHKILTYARTYTNHSLIIAGDTNMRDAEDTAIEDLGFVDAWKSAGSQERNRYSWDTESYIRDGETRTWQNLYYGQRTRAYRRRYDRVYVSSGNLELAVPSYKLIANTPVPPSRNHFLSDHFGLSVVLTLI